MIRTYFAGDFNIYIDNICCWWWYFGGVNWYCSLYFLLLTMIEISIIIIPILLVVLTASWVRHTIFLILVSTIMIFSNNVLRSIDINGYDDIINKYNNEVSFDTQSQILLLLLFERDILFASSIFWNSTTSFIPTRLAFIKLWKQCFNNPK